MPSPVGVTDLKPESKSRPILSRGSASLHPWLLSFRRSAAEKANGIGRLAGNGLRIKFDFLLYPCRRGAGAPSLERSGTLMSESLGKEFDGRVLNPSGVEIDIPFWAFKRLKKLHLLERDRETGKRRICARVFALMEIWEGPEFRPDRPLQALPLGGWPTRPNNNGYSNPFLKALGRDCSGLS
jgi:hypothetical protein